MIAGKDGSVKLGTNVMGSVDSFSLALNVGTTEVTGMGDSWKKYMETIKDGSGSLSAVFDYSDAGQKAVIDGVLTGTNTYADCEFKVDTDLTLKGKILITSTSINASVNDKISVSFNFVTVGGLAAKT